MVVTTRIKIFLKRYSPSWVFLIIRFIADKTILKILPLFFVASIKNFKERTIKHVTYRPGKEFDIVIDPRNGYLDQQVYAKKLYEPHIVKEFVDNIQEGDVCIDIGANIGHHTIIMAHSAGPSGKVYAFEPIPYIREQMLESLGLNHIHTVEVRSEALSDEEGEMTLHLNRDSIASSSFLGEGSETIPVSVHKLDSFSFEKVSFIKIDVEGFEYKVFKGAEKVISTHHPKILFEYSPIYYRTMRKEDEKDILTFLRNHNYVLLDLEDGRKEIHAIDDFIQEFSEGMRSQTNILALPR